MKTPSIKSVLVNFQLNLQNHRANNGELTLGNASSIKKKDDGRVYISGQMSRHAFFCQVDRLNDAHNGTYVSNGDGITTNPAVDIRSDMGGFLVPKADVGSIKRNSPISATEIVAKAPSNFTSDLLVRFKCSETSSKKTSKKASDDNTEPADKKNAQALASVETSDSDEMLGSFCLDVNELGIHKSFRYENVEHVETFHTQFITDTERLRRIKMFVEAATNLTDFAGQARNSTASTPSKVFIAFDTVYDRYSDNFFNLSEEDKQTLVQFIQKRGGVVFYGETVSEVLTGISNALETLTTLEFSKPANITAGVYPHVNSK